MCPCALKGHAPAGQCPSTWWPPPGRHYRQHAGAPLRQESSKALTGRLVALQEERRSLEGENICTKALQPSNSREKEAATEQAEPPEPRSALPEPRPAGAQGRRSGGPLPVPPQHSCCSTAASQRPGLCSQQHKNTEPSRQGPFRGYSPEKNRKLKIKGPTGKAAQPCRTQPRHSGEGARAARRTVLCPRGFEWFHHCLHISFVVLVCSHRCFAMMGWGQVQDFPALSLGNHQLMRFC